MARDGFAASKGEYAYFQPEPPDAVRVGSHVAAFADADGDSRESYDRRVGGDGADAQAAHEWETHPALHRKREPHVSIEQPASFRNKELFVAGRAC